MPNAGKPFDKQKAKQFLDRVVSDISIAMHGAMNYFGDKLGIFAAMKDCAPVTVEQLAARTGLSQRYLREWLGSMVAARYLEYDAAARTYNIPPEHVGPLADENSPVFLGGFMRMIGPNLSMTLNVAEAFKTGNGVAQNVYPPETFEAIERGTAPFYKYHLVQEWIPLMPEVKAALENGGTALDVGCGSGRAPITLARAFPKARLFGFDSHQGSIERARANAKQAGVSDRVEFEVVDCTRLPENRFDFISTFDVVHDSADPVALVSAIRKSLKSGGTYLMLEMNVSSNLEENISTLGRMMYSISTMYCMSVSLAGGGAGLGAAMGETKAREIVKRAGFGHFRRLPLDDPFSALYEIKQ